MNWLGGAKKRLKIISNEEGITNNLSFQNSIRINKDFKTNFTLNENKGVIGNFSQKIESKMSNRIKCRREFLHII